MAQLMDTPNGPLLCSRINAGTAIRGDVIVTEHDHQVLRIADVVTSANRPGFVLLHVNGTISPWTIQVGRNTPVWRAVGARAGGTI